VASDLGWMLLLHLMLRIVQICCPPYRSPWCVQNASR
jgi:hypothetical protein